ncbi:MAG TPA: TonB-dependent receptor [Candidatus Aminicenantes bacterium]|mgnify:CR=1 FL=1|nr:TonB-dependent receptor [Candidatus Aminicenantes bacterium]
MFRRSAVLASFIALFPLIPAGLLAEDRQGQAGPLQHDIVVTATRLETPEKKVGSSITVVSGEELVRTGRSFVLDALVDVLGLSVVRAGGPGASASVFVRGANSEHTLVLLNGVELNDPINPSRSCDISHLPLSQVERVEVLRGPQGLLYGSDALGGVVNIITRSGRGQPRLSLASSFDTLSSLTADLSLAGAGRKADYAFSAFHERTAGLSAAAEAYPGNTEKDGYRNLTLAGRFGYAFTPASRLTLTVRGTADRAEIDNFGGPGGDDPNNVQSYKNLLVRGQHRSLSANGRWEKAVSLSWVGTRRATGNPVDPAHPADSDRSLYRGGLVQLDWQNNFFLRPTHTLTAGLEAASESGSSDCVSESAYGLWESAFPSVRARSAGLYLLDHWESGGRFFVTTGVRADGHSRSGAAVTFRAAPAYLIAGAGTRFKASLGSGFKSPSLYQLFAPATPFGPVGNPLLRPERSLGWDAGVEQSLAGGRTVLEVTWFNSSFRDLVTFDYGAGYVNIGRARTQGLEVSAKVLPGRNSRLLASYTRLSARDLVSGTELPRRPRDKFSAEAGLRPFGAFDLAVHVLCVGRRLDRDFSAYPYPTTTLPGYVLLDLVITKTLRSGLEVFARVDNLLNADYQTVWGYGSPGRVLRTGLRLALY